MIHELDIRSLRRSFEVDGISCFRAGRAEEVDDIVIDHDGGHHDICASLAGAIREKRRVDQHTSFNFANAFGRDIFGELLDD